MKELIEKVLTILIFVGIAIYLVGTAIFDMTNKENMRTINIDMAAEVFEVDHAINSKLINKLTFMKRTHHYYIGINEDTDEAYIIKAPEKWFKENFNSDCKSINTNGLEITALAKLLSESNSQELISYLSQTEGLTYPIGMTAYLDIEYKKIIIIKFILFAVMLLLFVSILLIFKYPEKIRIPMTILGIILVVMMIIWAIAFIYILVI